MERECPKCGEMCEGDDLGDHPAYLTFSCECGHIWDENCIDDFYDQADNLRKARLENGEAYF